VEVRKTRTFVKPSEGEVSLATLRVAPAEEAAAKNLLKMQARVAAEEAARKLG
jgi:hypothetical protein